MEIDVSSHPNTNGQRAVLPIQDETASQPGLYQVASMDDRRLAAVIDFFCLLFAYGGFLGLFGSLGGHFTLSKLSAAVCVTTFAIVYLQYFALFTIFGGTTPGMMLRGLQVVSFSGDTPAPRQMLLRTVGYMLSAGTFFLGFLWAIWDCDELTWHDRFSRTYLSVEQTLPDLEGSDAARSR
ncbi:MAG TPA: RDD family protein [Candidatus Acidoferrum sp.]